jgi:hypothetical protein
MSRIKVIMVAMLAVFALGAVASASASAAPVWEECAGTGTLKGPLCEPGSTGTAGWVEVKVAKAVTSSGGEFILKAGTNEVKCTKVTDKGTVGPGSVDLAEEIKFEDCTTATKGCEVKNKGGTLGTVVVTEIPTKLEEIEGKVVDTFSQKTVGTTKEFVTLEFSGSTCSAAGYTTTKVKGDVAAEVKNETNGTVTLTFPKTAIPVATKLEAFGVSATLSGSDNEKLASGVGLRVS